jgi:hypothetical protein
MASGVPPVGITQNERFLSCDTVLLGVRYLDILSHSGPHPKDCPIITEVILAELLNAIIPNDCRHLMLQTVLFRQ